MRRVLGSALPPALRIAFAVYVAAVLYLTLTPRGDTAGSGVDGVVALAHALGFASVTWSQVEVALNVILFVPLGILGPLVWPRVRARTFVYAGAALSWAIEGFQAWFLPHRTPSGSDLVANTAGVLLGVLALSLVRREVRATRTGPAGAPSLLPVGAVLALGAALAAGVAVLVFTPTPELASAAVRGFSDLMADLGAPWWLSSNKVWERLLNIALFVPVGVFAGLVRPGWSYARWAVLGFGASLGVEVVQAMLLPGRQAAWNDVLMNGLGMLAGAALTHPLRAWWLRRHSARR